MNFMDKIFRKVLMANYMQLFECSGSSCEDNCCKSFLIIQVDREKYKKYQKINEPELEEIINKVLCVNPDSTNDKDFAVIKLDQNLSCPFLTNQNLCLIKQKLGKEYMPDICASFPCQSYIVNDVLIKSAALSCPQAARLILLNPKGIEFNEFFESVDENNVIVFDINTKDNKYINKPLKYLCELNSFTIDLLKNKKLLISERLITLGIMFEKINEQVENGAVDTIPEFIKTFKILSRNSLYVKSLLGLPVSYEKQLSTLMNLADRRFKYGITTMRYLDCYNEFLKGIHYSDEAKIKDISKKYSEAYYKHYLPFLKKHDYIIENYLVNYVISRFFPFTFVSNRSLFDCYSVMIIYYSLIKMFLIGIAGFNRGLTAELAVKLVQSFSRAMEHNPVYIRQEFEYLKQNNKISMDYLSVLIKN